jgi:hypothetical protein
MTVLMITQDVGGTNILNAGGEFNIIGTQAAVQGQRTTAFYRVHTAENEADVNFTGSTDEWIVTAVLIRGATALSIHKEDRTNSANSTSNSLTSGTVTTEVANCLVLSCFGFDSAFKLALDNTSLNKSVNISKEINISVVQLCQYFNQITAGATDTLTALSEVQSEGGSALTIAIAEATPETALMSPMITQAYQVLKRYGGITTATTTIAAFIRHDAVTWADANGTITPTVINGLSLATIATFAEVAVQGTLSTWGSMTGLSHTGSAIDNTGRWYGRTHEITETDMTGKIFSIEFMMSEVSTTRLGAQGGLVYFQDSTGNWAAFQLSIRQRLVAGVSYVYFVDLENATPYDKSVSDIDWSDITRLAYLIHKRTTATNAVILRIKNAILLDKVIMVDGSSASPCSPAVLEKVLGGLDPAIGGHGAYILNTVQGKGQSLARFGVQYGDGTRKTYYDASATSLELPLLANSSLSRRFWQVPNYSGAGKVQIKASASDIVKQNACVIATDTEQDYIIDPTSSTSANYDFAGSSIIGWRVAHNVSGITINGATFQNCRITLNGGAIDGCIVSNSKAPVITNDPEKISNTSFVSPGTGYAIQITATGTYNFTGNTFTGYGLDGTANAAIYNSSGGLVTLVLPAGSQEPTITNLAGGSDTIIELPEVYQSVTITGGVDDTRVQIYDTLNDEELVNEIVTSFPFTWTDDTPYTADRTIRVRTMYVDGVTAKIFTEQNLGTLTELSPSVNYLLEQKDDTVYETNNIDGSTVTEVAIDDDLLLVQIDTGQLSWGTIYAYETYWLYTEEGIRDEGRFIEAIDPANYKVYGFKIKNVTSPSVPLELIGGWAVDSETGKSIDLIDNTGGTLFSAPDHVVSYAVSGGSGGATAAEVWSYGTRRLSSAGITDIQSGLATSSAVSSIPTNPLLSDDTRLSYIDASISSRASESNATSNKEELESDISAITGGLTTDEHTQLMKTLTTTKFLGLK